MDERGDSERDFSRPSNSADSTHVAAIGTLSPSGSVDSSQWSGAARGSFRLSDRIRNRLDRRNTRNSGGALSPHSTSTNSTTPVKNTSSAFLQRQRNQDRVNSLLLPPEGSEEDHESFPRQNVKSPSSIIETLRSDRIMALTQEIQRNIANVTGNRSFLYESEDDGSIGSRSSRMSPSSARLSKSRSFSPIYEGMKQSNKSSIDDVQDSHGLDLGPRELDKVETSRKFQFDTQTQRTAPDDEESDKQKTVKPSSTTNFTAGNSGVSINRPEQQVPGAAGAKPGHPQSSEGDNDDGEGIPGKSSTETGNQRKTLEEISSFLTKAKTEFNKSGEQNRRYVLPSDQANLEGEGLKVKTDFESVTTERTSNVQSSMLFDRTEAFHKTGNAAVLALLTPRANTGDGLSVVSGVTSDIQSVFSHQSVVSSAFQTPKEMSGDYIVNDAYDSQANRDINQQLLSEETVKKLEKLKDTMMDPSPKLADLLTAIHTSEDFEADMNFTARRKNACGALQVLTTDAKNCVAIAWTVGVLTALTSVLRDSGEEGIYITYPDKRHRVEFEATRNRAISCLVNLSVPPANRIAIFHSPNLVQWLIVIINEGHGLSRKGACSILAHLGKTAENRLLMVQVPGMLECLTNVLKPRPPRIERIEVTKRRSKEIDPDGSDSATGERPQSGTISVRSSFSNESDATLRFAGSQSPVEVIGYDETADEYLRASRQIVFALLLHLVKEKDNAYRFVQYDELILTLATIAETHESPSHLLAIKVLASTTRHRLTAKTLVFKQRSVLSALVKGTKAAHDEVRLFSCYSLQNLGQDKACRQELAVTKDLISSLCERARKAKSESERLAAITALKNLCDEPANLIPMTNTPDCIATLMHLAHGMEEGITELMQYRACDGLATLSHWLRKIATSGQALDNAKEKKPPPKTLFVPSLQVVSFNQWT